MKIVYSIIYLNINFVTNLYFSDTFSDNCHGNDMVKIKFVPRRKCEQTYTYASHFFQIEFNKNCNDLTNLIIWFYYFNLAKQKR